MISDDILCQNFKAYMLLERGYSENTRIAYLSDLASMAGRGRLYFDNGHAGSVGRFCVSDS